MVKLSVLGNKMVIQKVIMGFSLFSMFTTLLHKYSGDEQIILFLTVVIFIFFVNDFTRERYQKHTSMMWIVSFIFSNVLAGFLLFKIYCIGTQIYIIILLVEIIVSTHKIPIYILGLHFTIFAASLIADHTTLRDILSSYLIIISIVYLFRNGVLEKSRTQELNQELQLANNKLHEYSHKIQELTISKERTRIAQELHDSLGHYLVALNMNLEYASTVVNIEPDKARSAINKAHQLSKECIVDLRKTVVLLSEERLSKELEQSLSEMFNNFTGTDKIQFELDMDQEIEYTDSDIKNCIYKTVQESITNGIKHGKATRFSIAIYKYSDHISLLIHNNGTGSKEIIKSKGIQGIEERILALGGSVFFHSNNSSGFNVEASIPRIADDFEVNKEEHSW
ncbi:sensory transduction protein kinase [Paenibacillus sp. FSL R7-269]|uniref:sensor histidine kinase n=1 Tax=Paenibacillus sp. FSL R7-269 TaxID=1226755 RepID=UPI0003E22B47|nr:sensor histidine kinase [Paenibacillus sp. FSL R7-269]ETT36334.1 sensory transduction protein kinase [Paenibacillus sp. FSL R7-269]